MKRFLAMMLALAMVLSMFPATALQVRAEELTEQETTTPAATSEPAEPEQSAAPTQSQPAQTEPAATDPEVTVPATTAPAESAPENNVPIETTPADTEPEETEPAAEPASDVPSGSCGENVTWTLVDGVLTITGSGAMDDYNYDTDSPWFAYRDVITSAVIENGVTTIGSCAFVMLEKLSSVSMPESLETICWEAFRGCSALASVTIPASVSNIDAGAFQGCDSLTNIEVAEDNTAYCDVDGVLFDKDVTTLHFFPVARSGSYTIPDSVTVIGNLAFINCNLSEIILPEGVETIMSHAFMGCGKLKTITLPSTVNYIGNQVFFNCTSLTAVDVAEGNETFCDVDGVLFSKDLTALVYYPFNYAGVYTIPSTVTTIEHYAFQSCNLASVTIPASVTFIGDLTFCGFSGRLVFEGNAPELESWPGSFMNCNIVAYYPETAEGWADLINLETSQVNITWISYGEEGIPPLENTSWSAAQALILGETIQFEAPTTGGYRYYTFTPEEDGYYLLYSSGTTAYPQLTAYENISGGWNFIENRSGNYCNNNFLQLMFMAAGETYGFRLNDYQGESFAMTFEKSNIVGVELASATDIYEYTSGYWDVDYFRYFDPNMLRYTVTFDDGTQNSGTGSYSFVFNGEDVYLSYGTSSDQQQSAETPWVAGNTYTMYFHFLGKVYPHQVTILEAPENITLELDPIRIPKDSDYGWSYGYNSAGEYVEYKYYWWFDHVTGSITIDGTSYDIYNGMFYHDEHEREYQLWRKDNQGPDNAWGVGTHEVTIGIMGAELTMDVLIYDDWEIAETLTLNESVSVENLGFEDFRTFTFTPEEDGYYAVYSSGEYPANMGIYEQLEDGTWGNHEWNNADYYDSITDFSHPLHLMPMTAGHTYGFKLFNNWEDMTIGFTVTLEKTDITDITIDTETSFYEYTHGYWDEPQGYWNEYEGFYRYTNLLAPISYTVTYADGTQETGKTIEDCSFEVAGKRAWFFCSWNFETYQSSYDPWTAGNSYEMYVDFIGSNYTVTINILEAPENVTLTLDPVTASCHDYEYYNDVFGDGESYEWIEYYWTDYINGTITIDGTEYPIRNGRFYYPDAGYHCQLWTKDDQTYDHVWEIDTAYEAIAGVLGAEAECFVTVEDINSFDDSIYDYMNNAPALADMTAMEPGTLYPVNITTGGDIGWLAFTPTEDGTYCFSSTCNADGEYYDTYGMLFDGNFTSCLAKNDDAGTMQFSIMQELTAGETYVLAARMLSSDVVGTFQVSVQKVLALTELRVDPITIPADAFCHTEIVTDSDGNEMLLNYYEWAICLQGTAIFEDGSSVSFAGNNFRNNGVDYSLTCVDTQGTTCWGEGNTYPISVKCGAATAETTVEITACSIKSITFKNVTIPEAANEGAFYYWEDALSWTVTFKDGKKLTGSGRSFVHKGNYYFITANDDQYENPFVAGNTYTVYAMVGPHKAPVNVTIKAVNHDLPVVTGLNIKKVTSNSIQIVFDKVPGAAKYELYLDGAYITSTNKTTYTFTGLTAGEYYEVDVAAVIDGVSGPLTGGIYAKPYTDISKYTVVVEPESIAYDGTAKTPAVTLKNGSKVIDPMYYAYNCSNNVEIGQAMLIVFGEAIYGGAILTDFRIVPAQVTGLEVTELDDENGTATITFDAVHGADEYWVYNGTKRVAVITDTTYTFTGLKLGTTYNLSVRANANIMEYDLDNYDIFNPEEPEQVDADYTGEAATVSVRPTCDLEGFTVQLTGVPKAYTGKAQAPAVKVIGNNGKALRNGSDYTVSFENNIEIGTATVIITGKGKYEGTLTETFEIVPPKAGVPTVKTLDGVSAEVSFKEVKQAQWYEVLVDGEVKSRTADLSCVVTGLTAGKAHKFTIRAGVTIDEKDYIGAPGNAKTATAKHDMSICTLTLEQTELVYTGKALKPALTVTGYEDAVLTEKVDYTVVYKNNKGTGLATVTVTGKGAYAGKAATTFIINPAQPTGLKVKSTTPTSVTITFTKSPSAQYYDVYLDGEYHGKTTRNTYTFSDLVKGEIHNVYIVPQKAIKTVIYTGAASDHIQIWAGTDIAKFKVTQEYVKATYAGEPMCPTVVVKTSAKKTAAVLTEGVDYKVMYLNNNAPGKASIVIQGIGEYAGTITKTFTISMAKPTGVVATATGTDSIHVEFNSVPGATEYQVCVNGKVKATITDTSCDITGLKKNTTYKITVKALSISGTYKQTTVSAVVKVKTPNA